jgi:hypothetical protein
MRDDPGAVLARHFFTSLFDFGVLSEDGAESLKRVLLGGLSLAIAGGLLLTRIFMTKYGALAGEPVDAYLRAVVADHAFLMALPMWIVAAAMSIAGQSLFPDERDFRILMAEPLPRSTIFGAKLAALLLFAGLFVAGSQAGLLPLAALTLIGAAKTGALVPSALAYVVASLLAGLFAAVGIVAIHGVLVLVASRQRLLAISGAVRILLAGGLVLALPLVTRLPATADAFATHAWWLPWAPPAWFAGLERWLLGDPAYGSLAAQAVVATAAAAAIAGVAYVRLYQRFDRVTFQAASPARLTGREPSLAPWRRGAPVRGAVHRFVTLTIRRSVLHQGLVVGLLAAAGGLVLNSLIGTDWRDGRLDAMATDVRAAILLWAPMTLVFLAIPAIRLALSIPMDLRANWIFRMAEDVDGRAEVADASVRAVLTLAVALPIALLVPLQARIMGRAVLPVLLVEAAIGWLLVERLMRDWHRIPFTCSYLPGKGFVPQMCVKAFAAYVLFTLATGVALRLSLRRVEIALALAAVLGLAAAALRLRRIRQARERNLLFDEELPTELTPLRLSAD